MAIRKQKNIALITHDREKREPVQRCGEHKDILLKHFLCEIGTAARTTTDAASLPVKGYNSGLLDGGQQIGAKIVEGKIGFVIFFSDLPTAWPHDPDVRALLRTAQVYDIPTAGNKASVDSAIASPLMDEGCKHGVVNFRRDAADRVNTLQEQDI